MTKTLAVQIFVVMMIVGLKVGSPASRSGGPSNHTVTKEQYEQWKKDLSNWGRWGKDDQVGTLNLITATKRKQAAALVKEGVSVSLAGDPDTVKSVDNPNPYEHEMQGIGSDRWGFWFHGQAHPTSIRSRISTRTASFTTAIGR